MSESAPLDLAALLIGNQMAAVETVEPADLPGTPQFSTVLAGFQADKMPLPFSSTLSAQGNGGASPIFASALEIGNDMVRQPSLRLQNASSPPTLNLTLNQTNLGPQPAVQSAQLAASQLPTAVAKQVKARVEARMPSSAAKSALPAGTLTQLQLTPDADTTTQHFLQTIPRANAIAAGTPGWHSAPSQSAQLEQRITATGRQERRGAMSQAKGSMPAADGPLAGADESRFKILPEGGDISVRQSVTKDFASAVQTTGLQLEQSLRVKSKLTRVVSGTAAGGIAEPVTSDRPLTALAGEASATARPAISTEALASDIASMRLSGQSHARVSLRPAALGEVEIRLKITPSGTDIELIAASDSAADLLTQSLPKLRAQLNGAGIQTANVDVSSDPKDLSQNDSQSPWGSALADPQAGPFARPAGEYSDGADDDAPDLDSTAHLVSINRQSRLLDALA